MTRFLRGKFARFFLKIFVDGRAPGQARIGENSPPPPPLYIKPYIKPYILFTKPAHNCYIAFRYNNYIFLARCFSNFEVRAAHGICLFLRESVRAVRAARDDLAGPSVVHLFFHTLTLPEKRPRASFFSHFFRFFFRIFFLQVCALGLFFPHETKSPLGWCRCQDKQRRGFRLAHGDTLPCASASSWTWRGLHASVSWMHACVPLHGRAWQDVQRAASAHSAHAIVFR